MRPLPSPINRQNRRDAAEKLLAAAQRLCGTIGNKAGLGTAVLDAAILDELRAMAWALDHTARVTGHLDDRLTIDTLLVRGIIWQRAG